MGKVLYLSEIVKFAIEKEKQSYALYSKLHDEVTDETTKSIFADLMEQELQHEKLYEHMLEHVKEEQTPKVEEDAEYHAYMEQLIAESRKISPIADLDFNNLTLVFDYAIGREKDAILFYIGLKNYVAPHAHKKIDDSISEEGRHIVVSSRLKEKLA